MKPTASPIVKPAASPDPTLASCDALARQAEDQLHALLATAAQSDTTLTDEHTPLLADILRHLGSARRRGHSACETRVNDAP